MPESYALPNNVIQYIAAKAIIIHDGRVLVLRQNDDPAVSGYGRCHPPGGIVEPGEKLRETLAREVQEECGIDVEIGEVVSVEEWEADIRGDHCMFVGVFFRCKLTGEADIKLQAEEAQQAVWVGPDDLESVEILEPSLSVIRRVLS
jgi:8-oxo-dGTP diphosphatase